MDVNFERTSSVDTKAAIKNAGGGTLELAVAMLENNNLLSFPLLGRPARSLAAGLGSAAPSQRMAANPSYVRTQSLDKPSRHWQ
jgi:hypothetical protein